MISERDRSATTALRSSVDVHETCAFMTDAPPSAIDCGSGRVSAATQCSSAIQFSLGGERNTIEASRFQMIPLSAQVWGLRILVFASLMFLCSLAGSGIPAMAFGLAWGPNVLFLFLTMRGTLQLPRFLVPVQPIEPVIYRWVGVGLAKRIVATRMWPLMHGSEPPPRLSNRQDLLDRTAQDTKIAEVCHGATFIVVNLFVLFYLVVGRFSDGLWSLAFNVLLNGYAVMAQRVNRWRVQEARASMRQENLTHSRASLF